MAACEGRRQLTAFLLKVKQALKVATVHSVPSTLALFSRRLPVPTLIPTVIRRRWTTQEAIRTSSVLQLRQPVVATAWTAAPVEELLTRPERRPPSGHGQRKLVSPFTYDKLLMSLKPRSNATVLPRSTADVPSGGRRTSTCSRKG